MFTDAVYEVGADMLGILGLAQRLAFDVPYFLDGLLGLEFGRLADCLAVLTRDLRYRQVDACLLALRVGVQLGAHDRLEHGLHMIRAVYEIDHVHVGRLDFDLRQLT